MSGPLPVDRPVFPAAFVVYCQQVVARRTVSYQLHQRARLVLLFDAQPFLSHTAAAAAVGLHPDSVRHWRHRWATGEFSLEDRLGRGCPPRFSPSGTGAGQSPRLRTGGRNPTAAESTVAGRPHCPGPPDPG